MKRVAAITAAVILANAAAPARSWGASAVRDPFQRPDTEVAAGPGGTPVGLRLAGRVRTGERELALLVAADGTGRIVEEGSLLPDLGLRVLQIGTKAVRLGQIAGGDELLVVAAPGGFQLLSAEEER